MRTPHKCGIFLSLVQPCTTTLKERTRHGGGGASIVFLCSVLRNVFCHGVVALLPQMNQSSTGTQSQQTSVATTTASQTSRGGAVPPHPPTVTVGTGSHTPHQPVEFNHAISYVNKIKVYILCITL